MKQVMRALSTKGSLRRKISFAMLVAMVLIFPPIMGAVDFAARESIEQQVLQERQVEMAVDAAAIAKPLYDFDFANVRRLAQVIVARSDVDRIEVLDAAGQVVADTGMDAHDDSQALKVAIRYGDSDVKLAVGQLRTWFNTDGATQAIRDFYWRTAVVVVVSLAVIFCVLMVTLRQLMLRPVGELMRAINSSSSGGDRALARWESRDELGHLVNHFNAMQIRLSQDEMKLKAANENLLALYNHTPAMLFSLDEQGRIVEVSDYWVIETGYSREEALGRVFSELLVDCARENFAPGSHGEGASSGDRFARWHCQFRKKDGRTIDVYVSEALETLEVETRSRALLVMVDISELKRAEAELLRHARTDSLTGLPNRRYFKEKLSEALVQAELDGGNLNVLFIDLDRFKWINDHLGHHAGDEVLSHCAERMSEILPERAFFARLGGDEFAIFFRDEEPDGAAKLSRAINQSLNRAFPICGSSVTISASIGVATYPDNSKTVGGLLRAADLAMYRTKRAGRRGFSNYEDSIGDEARRLFKIEELMKTGSVEERYHLDYQPIVRLSDQRIVGAEGLLRMRDLEGGVVPPNDFIPVAEEVGLMPELGAFALRRGSADFAQLHGKGEAKPPRLAINLSPVQVTQELPEQVMETLEKSGFPPDRMVLEITESVFLRNERGLLTIFERLQALGCRLALDDFGTGYSSLSYLNDFPVDIVKIDRQFVRGLDGDGGKHPDEETQRRARALLQGVAAIAHELRLETVAEGVETHAQRKCVQDMGVTYGQGYLWSRPVRREAYIELLLAQHASQSVPA